MDVKGNEWNDEHMVVRMWVGYMWKIQLVKSYFGYKTINMILAFINAILHVYISNSKLNIYPILLKGTVTTR